MFLELEAIAWHKNSEPDQESKMHLFDGLSETTLCGKQIPFRNGYSSRLMNQDWVNCESCVAEKLKVARWVWRDD